MEPDCRAHCMTGYDTPSSWMKTTPSTSGSGTSWGGSRRRVAAKDSSVPALISQVRTVPKAAAIQAAATAVQNESNPTPGTTVSASCITTAWPNRVASATAIHPMAAASSTRSGRTIMPTSPVAAAATTSGVQDV